MDFDHQLMINHHVSNLEIEEFKPPDRHCRLSVFKKQVACIVADLHMELLIDSSGARAPQICA